MDILRRYVWIFVSPDRVFDDIRNDRAQWWQPWLLLSVVGIVVGVFALPIQKAIIELNTNNVSADEIAQQLEFVSNFGWIQVGFTPLVVLVVSLIVTGVTYILIASMATSPNFKRYFTLSMFAGVIGVLAQVVSTFVVRVRGLESIRSVADTQAAISLAFLAPTGDALMRGLLSSIELFSIWSLVVVALGLESIFDMQRSRAITVAVLLWIVSALLQIAGQFFSGNA